MSSAPTRSCGARTSRIRTACGPTRPSTSNGSWGICRLRCSGRSSARTPRTSTGFRWPEHADQRSPRRRRAPTVTFFVPLVVEGALAGMVYALIALAFVLVYKASRMVNFALGEWVMLGARLVGTGAQVRGLSLGGAVGLGIAGMVAFAVAFNRWVVRPLV